MEEDHQLKTMIVQLRIGGMHCKSCVSNICGTLEDLQGVINTDLTLEEGVATVKYNNDVVTLDQIIDDIKTAGDFNVTVEKQPVTLNINEQGSIEEALHTTVSLSDRISTSETSSQPNEHMKNAIELRTCFLNVQGMTCASCVSNIERQMSKTKGVVKILVSLMGQRAEVKYDSTKLTPEQIAGRITALGFPSEVIDGTEEGMDIITVNIEGITSDSNINQIQSHMSKVPGVMSNDVDLSTGRGRFQYDSNSIGPRDIIKHLNDLNFPASALAENSHSDKMAQSHRQMTNRWRYSFLIAAMFGIPAMILMTVFMLHYPNHKTTPHIMPGLSLENFLMFLLATPVQFISGRYFYIQAYKSLRHGSANMDVLIVLSTTISYVYSVIILLVNMFLRIPSPVTFFDVSPMLFMFVSLGRWLEHIAKGKTSQALKKLLSLKPPKGILVKLDLNGRIIEEEEIPAQLIHRDDLLKVLPGEDIPTDGKIIHGITTCDESLLTGESIPVDKTINDIVIGGTKNGFGQIIMQATHTGQKTALSQIIRLVQEAQTSKAPIQQSADKIAGYFVPVVVFVSILTLLIYILLGFVMFDKIKHYSLYSHSSSYHATKFEIILELAFRYALTVLSIACPCALGLATPTAVMVSTGVGASNGILIKGGIPLEFACKIGTVIFDKTGTITRGKPSVVDKQIYVNDTEMTMDRMLAIAATAESGSEHPLALAIRAECKSYFDGSVHLGRCDNFQASSGFGLSADVSNIDLSARIYKVKIGNREFMKRNMFEVSEQIDEEMCQHEMNGHTTILLAIDDKLIGMFAVTDEIKSSAKVTVYALKSMGIQTFLVTGDNQRTARAIAAQVGIEEVYAEVTPVQKARLIDRLKEHLPSKDHKIAMVGDGINDSIALARADVGIAIGSGTDVAVEAASIVLIRDELFDVVAAILLSKKTVRRIHLNFLFATIYNLIGIPIAAGALLPLGVHLTPWMASATMALSSISVVISSLLIRSFRKPNPNDYQGPQFRRWLERSQRMNIVTHHREVDTIPFSYEQTITFNNRNSRFTSRFPGSIMDILKNRRKSILTSKNEHGNIESDDEFQVTLV